MAPRERPWHPKHPGQFMDRGHPAGDFLEAYDWKVLEQARGHYRIDAHLPQQVRNPRGALFGGFTPTYIDLVAVYTARSLYPERGSHWMATLNLRVDYLAPVRDDRLLIVSHVVHERGRTALVEVRLLDHDGALLVTALVTLRATDVALPE